MNIYKLLAIYSICADYHSGQWSRGYRLLCKIGDRLNRAGITHPLDFISVLDNETVNDYYIDYACNQELIKTL